MLYLISSIQTPTYLAHCYESNDIQYAQVVKLRNTLPHIFSMAYHLPQRIPSVNSAVYVLYFFLDMIVIVVQRDNTNKQHKQTKAICAIAHCPPTACLPIKMPNPHVYTSCGLLNLNGL